MGPVHDLCHGQIEDFISCTCRVHLRRHSVHAHLTHCCGILVYYVLQQFILSSMYIRTWLWKGMLFREPVEFPSELDLIWGNAVRGMGSRDDESGLSFIDWDKLLSRVASTIPQLDCRQTSI